MDVASAAASFIGLVGQVINGVMFLIDFCNRILEAPDNVKALTLELGSLQHLLVQACQSYTFLQSVGCDIGNMKIAVNLCQSWIDKLKRLVQQSLPRMDLGGFTAFWSQLNIAFQQSKLARYMDGLRSARSTLSAALPFAEMPLRYHQYKMMQSMEMMLSDLANTSSSTSDAVERAVQELNIIEADLSKLSFDQTTAARIVSSVDDRLGRIDYDVAAVKAATNQLLNFREGTDHRLYHLLKPTIESAISDCLVRHFQQDKIGASDYRKQNRSSMKKSEVRLDYHELRKLDQGQLSAMVNTSFPTADLGMWASGHLSPNDDLETRQMSFSFGYVSIQSIRGVFYKLKESLDIPPTTIEQHYMVTTVMLIPASCLFSKGAFSSLVQFAHDLQYPKFDLEIVPIIEHRGTLPKFCAQQAGDPNTLWELFNSCNDWIKDNHDLRTPFILTVRPSTSHIISKQKGLDWHLMRLLAQGMIASGTDMFSPQHHVWKTICPQERVIELTSDEEATGHNEAEIWFDAPETTQTAPDPPDLHNQESELIVTVPKPSKAARSNKAPLQTLDTRLNHTKRLRRVTNRENLRLEKGDY